MTEDDPAPARANATAASAPDPALFVFFNEIGIIAQLSGTAFERSMPAGMTRSQFSLLNHLERLGGPRSLAALARSFQVTKGAMTNTTQKLVEKGLISVRPDPEDGRGKLVDITGAGRAMRRACIDGLGPWLAALAADIPPARLAALTEDLSTVRRWLDDHRDLDRKPT